MAGGRILKGMKNDYIFPSAILGHTVTFHASTVMGDKAVLLVDPSETFGHALARYGVNRHQIKSIAVGGPLSYEPDYRVATR